MEELRSTDILDKEIEAAAQKKAEKILKNASQKCEEILSSVEKRIEDERQKKEKFYEDKLNLLKNNHEASFPLEKERFLADFYAKESGKSITFFLKNIDEEKRLSVLEKRFDEIKNIIEKKDFNVSIYGLDFEKAKSLVSKKLKENDAKVLDVKEIAFETSGEEKTPFIDVHFGIILRSSDNFVKCVVSIDNILSNFIDKNSLEIAKTLFSGRLPE